MVQEAKRDAEMEKVYGVFEEYIKSSPYIEWLWSEKLGYVLMQIAAKEREVVESRVVTDAAWSRGRCAEEKKQRTYAL